MGYYSFPIKHFLYNLIQIFSPNLEPEFSLKWVINRNQNGLGNDRWKRVIGMRSLWRAAAAGSWKERRPLKRTGNFLFSFFLLNLIEMQNKWRIKKIIITETCIVSSFLDTRFIRVGHFWLLKRRFVKEIQNSSFALWCTLQKSQFCWKLKSL